MYKFQILKLASLFLLLTFFNIQLSATTYFVSPSGNDNNNGLSENTPYQTLSKINTLDLEPGDFVSLEGGQTFIGYLIIKNSGTADNPITIKSYNWNNAGRAIIQFDNLGSSKVKALEIKDASNVIVKNLILVGDYIASEDGSQSAATANAGLDVFASSTNISNVIVDNVDISQFTWAGLRAKSNTGFSANQIQFLNCEVHHNGFVGIATRDIVNDIYIASCKAHHNTGWDASAAGSAIHLSGANNATVEYCIAHHNGGNNGAQGVGGGGGIWASYSSDVLFQYNESYQNETKWADGCGFDIDGGVQNAIVQYNYSHDNFGAGFLVFQFDDGATKNVTIRYNISQNDGTWGKHGAIHIHRKSNIMNPIEDVYIYNNTIYNDNPNTAMIEMNGGNGNPGTVNIHSLNNIFVQPNGGTDYHLVNNATIESQNNFYDPADGDSFLSAPGTGGIIGDATLLSSLTAYQVSLNSPLIGAGVNPTAVNINGLTDYGTSDFFGNPIPFDGNFDIGAHEFSGTVSTTELSESLIEVYPNPTKDIIFIRGENDFYDINVLNGLGQTILSERMINQFNLKGFTKGIYFLEIVDSARDEKWIKKIFVE